MTDIRIHNPAGVICGPCPDCGRSYTMAESVQVRVAGRPEPAWSGCLDCWIVRTSPEMCESLVWRKK